MIEAYARFRGGRAFLIALAVIIAGWIGWTELPGVPHFDGQEFGRLNLFLSAEASLSVALLIMAGEKRERQQRAQLEHIEHLVEMAEAALERKAP
jgi:uncharacterized membrane protein